MNKLLLSLSLLVASFHISAQITEVPKYVLVEHFTNSRCGVCASRNPAMFTLLAQYPTEVHHIAVHPVVPYSNCVFYQANTADNSARASLYTIQFTPQVALNGDLLPSSSQLLPAAKLTAELNQTSPIAVVVTEANGVATVKITSYGTVPAGDYVLHAAMLEKVINQTTPNGESVHRDVLRDLLSATTGDAITLPETGQSIEFQYTLSANANWAQDQLYVLAWLQNTQDKVVLNSGTKFDPLISGTNEVKATDLVFSPNPANDWVSANIAADEVPATVEVRSIEGRLIQSSFEVNNQNIRIPLAGLTAGLYSIVVRTDKNNYIGKVVKL